MSRWTYPSVLKFLCVKVIKVLKFLSSSFLSSLLRSSPANTEKEREGGGRGEGERERERERERAEANSYWKRKT